MKSLSFLWSKAILYFEFYVESFCDYIRSYFVLNTKIYFVIFLLFIIRDPTRDFRNTESTKRLKIQYYKVTPEKKIR